MFAILPINMADEKSGQFFDTGSSISNDPDANRSIAFPSPREVPLGICKRDTMTRPKTTGLGQTLDTPEECPINAVKGGRWLKRLGAAAFLFYLIKGLIWLGIFAAGGVGLFASFGK